MAGLFSQFMIESNKLEDARDEAIDNESQTVYASSKYKKYTPEQKHGIAIVRAFRGAHYYADAFGVDVRALRIRIIGSDSPSDYAYYEKESGKKLYE